MTPANTIVASTVSIAPPSSELAKYQKMSDKEHILKKPDTYIGSIEMTESDMFVYESSSTSSEASGIISRTIQYIPGLYK
jgi:DNA topoisomerase-2